MANILVMGGTTFVSRSLAEHLIGKGYQVDILTRGMRPVEFSGYRSHIKCDRGAPEALQLALSGREYDYIFDISAYTRQDVEILCSSIGVESLKKYIFCSSGSVYIPSREPMPEDFERGANINWGEYGLQKKEAEDYLFSLHEERGFPCLIFRPPYIYGGSNNLYREAYLFDRICSGKAVPIPDGAMTRVQFVHINDLVRVFEAAMHNPNIGKSYNLAYKEDVSWERLVACCGEIMERPVWLKRIDSSLNLEARSYFPFRDVDMLFDTSALIRDGFPAPSISLAEGLRLAYNDYVKGPHYLCDTRMNMIDHAAEA